MVKYSKYSIKYSNYKKDFICRRNISLNFMAAFGPPDPNSEEQKDPDPANPPTFTITRARYLRGSVDPSSDNVIEPETASVIAEILVDKVVPKS